MKKISERRERANEAKKRQNRELQIRAKALVDSGFSIEEISETLKVPVGVICDFLKMEETNEERRD